MKRNEIQTIYGTDYRRMTKELLQAADLISLLPGKEARIAIKPNLVCPSPASFGATTHPEVVAGLIEYLQEAGYENILITEGSWVGDKTADAYEYCGYRELCEKYHVPFFDNQKDSWHNVDAAGMRLKVCDIVDQVDFLINVPVIKGHCQTRVTCALKNLKGLLPNIEKRRFHQMGLHKPIAHLASAVRPGFILADHICGDPDFEEGGNPLVKNCILAALDPVLVDAYACQELGVDVSDVPYIGMAERLGVGSADLSAAKILSVNRPEEAHAASPLSEKRVLDVSYAADECDSCSACYASLIPAGPHYNNPDYDMAAQMPGKKGSGSNVCFAITREDTLKAIGKTPLLYEPGTRTVYSDVDYMLLTFVVEKVTGKRLDTWMKENFYDPMGLTHLTYLPLNNGFSPEDCAATELNGNTRDGHIIYEGIRTKTIQGEVHDERAWVCMEGVSGHAGLFANASDLAKLASVMLTGGYGEHRFFSRNVMDSFTAPKAFSYGQWGLGWWREGDDQRVWYFGTQAAPDTVGHQGWTGTLVMVDPSRDLVVAYLTNKINTSITDETNLNDFDGNCYTASTLGFVPQLLSIGMDTETDITGQLLDLLADMAAESLRLIPEECKEDHPYVKNAKSKIVVLKAWAEENGRQEYLDFAKELESALP